MRETASAASYPTHRMSCARRSRSSASTPRSNSPIPTRMTAQELADVVLAEQQRIQRLVEDLLVLARADEHVPLSREPVDLDDLAFEEARRLRSTTSKRWTRRE